MNKLLTIEELRKHLDRIVDANAVTQPLPLDPDPVYLRPTVRYIPGGNTRPKGLIGVSHLTLAADFGVYSWTEYQARASYRARP